MKLSGRFFKYAAVFMTFALCPFAFGNITIRGGMEGGGGKGVLCGTNLRVLDIYEAEEVYHLKPVQKYSTIQDNVFHYGDPLARYWSIGSKEANDPKLPQEFMSALQEDVLDIFSDIQTGTTLPTTNDATLPKLPPDCSVVQIAVYSDKAGRIYRDRNLWDKLDAYNQTALILHEIYYHAAREINATLSDDTRRLIGLTMFNQLPEPLWKPLWDQKSILDCSAGDNFFSDSPKISLALQGKDDIQNGQSGVLFISNILDGQLSVFRVTGFIPGATMNQVASSPSGKWLSVLTDQLTGQTWNLELNTNNNLVNARAWKTGEVTPAFKSGVCDFQEND